MVNDVSFQEVFLNVPTSDWSLLKELIKKFGWQSETREQLLDRFVESRNKKPQISEEDIMNEVKAVRCSK